MNLLLDDDRRVLVMGDAEARLPRQQWLIARELLMHSGKIVRLDRMLRVLYGHDPDGGLVSASRNILVLICSLRGRLRAIGADAQIVCIYGEGYRLEEVRS